MNAEQASKRTMRRPTQRSFRGRLTRLGEVSEAVAPDAAPGVVAAACTQGKRTKHGKPQRVFSDDQPEAREGQAWRSGVAERFVVPLKRVMPMEGRDLSSRQTQYVVKDLEIGQPINSASVQKLQKALHANA